MSAQKTCRSHSLNHLITDLKWEKWNRLVKDNYWTENETVNCWHTKNSKIFNLALNSLISEQSLTKVNIGLKLSQTLVKTQWQVFLTKLNLLYKHFPADSSGSEAAWSDLELRKFKSKSRAMYTLRHAFDPSRELQNTWDLVEMIFIYQRASP